MMREMRGPVRVSGARDGIAYQPVVRTSPDAERSKPATASKSIASAYEPISRRGAEEEASPQGFLRASAPLRETFPVQLFARADAGQCSTGCPKGLAAAKLKMVPFSGTVSGATLRRGNPSCPKKRGRRSTWAASVG